MTKVMVAMLVFTILFLGVVLLIDRYFLKR